MHEPKVQQATILFNDRINCFNKMKQLNNEIDNLSLATRTKAVKELAELRIRNLDAFRELQALNDTGDFLYKHPLIENFSEYSLIEKLWNSNTDEFLHQYANARDNVKRYTSYSKSDKYNEQEKENYKLKLLKWQKKLAIFNDVASKK